MFFFFFIFLPFWVIATKYTARYVWRTSKVEEPSYNFREETIWFFTERWTKRSLLGLCATMWFVVLPVKFVMGNPEKKGIWTKFIEWMTP